LNDIIVKLANIGEDATITSISKHICVYRSSKENDILSTDDGSGSDIRAPLA